MCIDGLFVSSLCVSTATQEQTGKLASQLSETLEGARLVKAYAMEAGEIERVRARIERRLTEIMRGAPVVRPDR